MSHLEPATDPHRRTTLLLWTGLATSLGALLVLLVRGSSVLQVLTSLGGAAILALLGAAFLMTTAAVIRAVRLGRPEKTLPFIAGIIASYLATALSVLLLLATLGSAGFVPDALDFRAFKRNHAIASAMRPWVLPADSSIDPVEAGEGVLRLVVSRTERVNPLLTLRPIVPLGATPWPGSLGSALPDDVFPKHRLGGSVLAPSLIDSLPRTLSAAERDFLAAVAAAPHWPIVAQVARAPRIDLFAATVELPIGEAVTLIDLPFVGSLPLKNLAQANAARIAFHLQRGDRSAARRAAEDLLSFGVRLMDDSRDMRDALMGITTVGIAREQLIRTLRVLRDPEAERIAATHLAALEASTQPVSGQRVFTRDMTEAVRERILGTVRDDGPSPLRWEMLNLLSILQCRNTREIVFGPDEDLREAFTILRTNLAQTASDSTLIALSEEMPERMARRGPWPTYRGIDRVAVVGARLTGHRRLIGCVAEMGFF